MKRIAFSGLLAGAALIVAAASAMAQRPAISDGPIPAPPLSKYPAANAMCCEDMCCVPKKEILTLHIPEWSCRCVDFCLPKCSLYKMVSGQGCCCEDPACCKVYHRKAYLKFDCEVDRAVNRCDVCFHHKECTAAPACPAPACTAPACCETHRCRDLLGRIRGAFGGCCGSSCGEGTMEVVPPPVAPPSGSGAGSTPGSGTGSK
jgi:hypothetical protein